MNSNSYNIRRTSADDFQQWDVLWQAYLEFYESKVAASTTELLWHRIHDPQHPIECFVAENTQAELIGLVHYFPHPSTWNARPYCYLEDLFVSPQKRTGGVGRALINAVIDEARKNQWSDVYWHTQEKNNTARILYDKITGGSDGFVCYRIEDIQ